MEKYNIEYWILDISINGNNHKLVKENNVSGYRIKQLKKYINIEFISILQI